MVCTVNSGVFFGDNAITLNICKALAVKRIVMMMMGAIFEDFSSVGTVV